MFGRYILLNYIKVFLLLLFVLLGMAYIYLTGEIMFLFKDKNLGVFLSYTLNFLPIAFFYLSSFITGLALLLVFRRLINKKLDLLIQSFGFSPLKLSSYFLFFSLLLSALNLWGSYSFYARSQKKLYQIEREHKKAKQVESGIVRNLWLKEEVGEETRFYNFELVEVSTGELRGFFLLKVDRSGIRELITASAGRWEGKRIELMDASIKDLLRAEEVKKDISIDYLALSQIKPLAERPEHLSIKDAFILGLRGESMGVNSRFYLYEMAKRLLTSILPVWMSLALSWFYLRWRRFDIAVLSLLSVFFSHWLLLNLLRSIMENTDIELSLALFLYLPLPALSLKGLYDLSKGFRV